MTRAPAVLAAAVLAAAAVLSLRQVGSDPASAGYSWESPPPAERFPFSAFSPVPLPSSRGGWPLDGELKFLPKDQLDARIVAMRDELKNSPDDMDLWVRMAIAHNLKGRAHYAAALNELHRARALGSLDLRVPYLTGRMCEELGLAKQAEQEYIAVLRNEPRQADSRLRLARMFARQNRMDAALDLLEEGHELMPVNVIVLCNLAEAYKAKGMADEALDKYDTAWELDRASWPSGAYKSYADLLTKQGNAKKAAKAVKFAGLKR